MNPLYPKKPEQLFKHGENMAKKDKKESLQAQNDSFRENGL